MRPLLDLIHRTEKRTEDVKDIIKTQHENAILKNADVK